ncbi:hypothetical protein BgiBS90_031817, partial [Biomphalaria glabrata]
SFKFEYVVIAGLYFRLWAPVSRLPGRGIQVECIYLPLGKSLSHVYLDYLESYLNIETYSTNSTVGTYCYVAWKHEAKGFPPASSSNLGASPLLQTSISNKNGITFDRKSGRIVYSLMRAAGS